MNEDRILQQLAPPSGGWQRLLARRDRQSGWEGIGLPLATASALILVLLLVQPQTRDLQLPWNGGRLVAQPSEGVGLRVVTQGRAIALPSDDTRVQLYWLQDTNPP